MAGTTPVTVGILAEPQLLDWQVRAIERLQRETDVEVPLVVRNASNADGEPESNDSRARGALEGLTGFVNDLRLERAWMLVLAERTVARQLGDDQSLWHRHPVGEIDCLASAEILECEPHTDGVWNELPDEIVAELADRCDVVVRFGFGLIRGDVLTAPEHGVISFHPADVRRYRGMGPPAIFHDGQERAGTTLQRLDESIDGGEIVAYEEVSLHDCYTVWDVFDRLATVQIRLLTEGVLNFRDPTFEPRTIPDDQLGDFYYRDLRRSPTFAGRVLAKNVSGRVRRRLESRLGADVTEEWRVADSDD
ncbi:formyltransferase family protein [Natrialbaceae archaeon A-gly3]